MEENKEKSERISGYDYRKWDKFDVDEALKDDEDEDEDEEDDEELEMEQLKQRAVVEKEKGNEYFKGGKFDQAIQCYTKGIQCDPSNPLLPANRAMALIKKGQFAAAEADCTVAIDLDPTYVKAYQRRATAREKLKRKVEAMADYQKVVELDPMNKVAKKEIERLQSEKMEDKIEKVSDGKAENSFSQNIR